MAAATAFWETAISAGSAAYNALQLEAGSDCNDGSIWGSAGVLLLSCAVEHLSLNMKVNHYLLRRASGEVSDELKIRPSHTAQCRKRPADEHSRNMFMNVLLQLWLL